MSDHLEELALTMRHLLLPRGQQDAVPPQGVDTELWDELAELGFVATAVPEELGGGGGTIRDAATLVREAAYASAAIPLAEAALVAAPLLTAAGARVPEGVFTAAAGRLSAERTPGGSWLVTGSLAGVPWLRSARHVVTLADTADGPAVAILPVAAPGLTLSEGTNLAGEQRDSAVLDGVEADRVHALPPGDWRHEAELYAAAARAVQIAGAARGVLDSTTRHTGERVQFGRPLARFQAVQHQLAQLAADVVTAEVVADAAILALFRGDTGRELAVAAAKAEASARAGSITAIGHQLHGAIGMTMEHRLGAHTARLWAWREEHGNELHWRRRIADLASDSGRDLWELVTEVASADVG
ncbi:acyl-CoA dehydrogenase family protein [Microtetraspora malaysiensis]|uniref:acyl-CoA dehydrogenase family protein n=1 Tax=Microtetraspora malaysiensis TaxID=161358 RepID=UPI003D8E2D07